jgi:N-hydroxyarylamine O-acetyltransferase
MTESNIENYLKRIQVDEAFSADLKFLTTLQNQHMLNIPFENLDIGIGKEIVLDYDKLYQKIVLNRRGGYCYELNGLFCSLLRQLGYTVDMLSARVYNSEGVPGHEFDHMTLLAHLEKDYLVDVGFGDSFRKPIEMPDGSVVDVSGKYPVRSNPEIQSGFFLKRFFENEWKPQYQFTTIPRKLSDFEDMNRYHQTSPESHFTQRSICTIAAETGRISLSDEFLTVTEGQEKQKYLVSSADIFKSWLKEYFDIVV